MLKTSVRHHSSYCEVRAHVWSVLVRSPLLGVEQNDWFICERNKHIYIASPPSVLKPQLLRVSWTPARCNSQPLYIPLCPFNSIDSS